MTLMMRMAEELGILIPYAGGVDHAHVWLPPLESLCTVEETYVGNKPVEPLCQISS